MAETGVNNNGVSLSCGK